MAMNDAAPPTTPPTASRSTLAEHTADAATQVHVRDVTPTADAATQGDGIFVVQQQQQKQEAAEVSTQVHLTPLTTVAAQVGCSASVLVDSSAGPDTASAQPTHAATQVEPPPPPPKAAMGSPL